MYDIIIYFVCDVIESLFFASIHHSLKYNIGKDLIWGGCVFIHTTVLNLTIDIDLEIKRKCNFFLLKR